MAEKTNLQVIYIPLTKENSRKLEPFYYWKSCTSLVHQLTYYELLGHDIRDEANLFLITGQVSTISDSYDLTKQVDTTVESRMVHETKNSNANIEEIMDYQFVQNDEQETKPMQVGWLNRLDKGPTQLARESPDKLISEFINHFIQRGLFDCNCSAFKSSSTLKLFFILLDLMPTARTLLIEATRKASSDIPQDFGMPTENEYDCVALALLYLLIERNKGSPVFIRCLSFLQNRVLLAKLNNLCLLAGDLMDEELFGFNDPDCLKKRALFYACGLESEAIGKTCEARLAGMASFFRSPNSSMVGDLLAQLKPEHKVWTIPPLSEAGSWPALDMVAKVNAFCTNCKSLTSRTEDYWKELLKHQLDLCMQNTTNIEALVQCAAVARRTIQARSCEPLDESIKSRISDLLDKQNFKAAAHLIGSSLRRPLTGQQLIDHLGAIMALAKELTKLSQTVRQHMDVIKGDFVLGKIQTFCILSSLEERVNKQLLISLGYDLYEQQTEDDDLELIKLSFCLLGSKPSDFELSKKALNFIANKRKITISSANDEVLSFMTKLLVACDSEEAFHERIATFSQEMIQNIKLGLFSDEEIRLLWTSYETRMIQPSLVCLVDDLISIHYHALEPLSPESPPKEPIDVIKHLVKKQSQFSDNFLKEFRFGEVPSANVAGSFSPSQKIRETADRLKILLDAEPCIALLSKDMFDVYATIEGLEIYAENKVEIYRAYFVSNHQKCTIFKVPYDSAITAENFMKTLAYVKMFHPKVLCFYGIILEPDFETEVIHIYYVAENFNTTLSMLKPETLEGMSSARKVQIVFDILYSLLSFHSVGISFSLLNPDLVTITSQTTKLIFPFFLPSRASFSGSYIAEVLDDNVLKQNLFFLKPLLLQNPSKASPPKLSLLDPKYFHDFHELMANDLYAFALMCFFIFSRSAFDGMVSLAMKCTLSDYLSTFVEKLKATKEVFLHSGECLGSQIGSQLQLILKEAKDSPNTFDFYQIVCSESNYEFPAVDLWTIKKNFQDTLGFIGEHTPDQGVYFPGCVKLIQGEKISENKTFFREKLVQIGPYFSLECPENYELTLFLSDFESASVKIQGQVPISAEISSKKRSSESLEVISEVRFDDFLPSTWMLSDKILKDPYKSLYLSSNINQALKEKRAISMNRLLAAQNTLNLKKPMIDPFGNHLHFSTNDDGLPDYSQRFFLEAITMHNLGKSLLIQPTGQRVESLFSRFATVMGGELCGKNARYADFAHHLEGPSMADSFILSYTEKIFNGDIAFGAPQIGQAWEKNGAIYAYSKELLYDGHASLRNDRQIYSGTLYDGVPNGQGKLVSGLIPIYEGQFRDGVPHGKGKLYKINETTNKESLFRGFFTKGKPRYGLLNAKTSCIDSLILISRDRNKDLDENTKDELFQVLVQSEAIQAYALGFDNRLLKEMNGSPLSYWLITPQFTLKQFTTTKLEIAENAAYTGMMMQGKPHGKGCLRCTWAEAKDRAKQFRLIGLWNSALNEVIGQLSFFDEQNKNLVHIKGIFHYTTTENRFRLSGTGYSRLTGAAMVVGAVHNHSFVLESSWVVENTSKVERISKLSSRLPDTKGRMPDPRPVIVRPEGSKGVSSAWYEEWRPNDAASMSPIRFFTDIFSLPKGDNKTNDTNSTSDSLFKVYNNRKSLDIRNVNLNTNGIDIEAKAIHIEEKIYELLDEQKDQVNQIIINTADSLIIGYVSKCEDSSENNQDKDGSTITSASKFKGDDSGSGMKSSKTTGSIKKTLTGFLFTPVPSDNKVNEYLKNYPGTEYDFEDFKLLYIPIPEQRIEHVKIFRGEFNGLEPKLGVLLDHDFNLHIGEFDRLQLQGTGIQWYPTHKVVIAGTHFNKGQKDGLVLVSDSLNTLIKEFKSAKKIFLGEYSANKKNGVGICYYYRDKECKKADTQCILFRHGEIQTVFSDFKLTS
jgi:hypothetical protein